jgi:uncharacterized protein
MQDRGGVVAISRQVKPGYEQEFEEAVRAVILAAENFPGYVGAEVLYPKTKHGEWALILRFDTPLHLQEWETSPVCQRWIARADALSLGAPKVMRVNGLEAWFALPEVPHVLPPPKWKTAVVSAVGLYPIISLMPTLLKPITTHLPIWMANLVSIIIMMPLMTWVIMPQVTRLFQRWLYPTINRQSRTSFSN